MNKKTQSLIVVILGIGLAAAAALLVLQYVKAPKGKDTGKSLVTKEEVSKATGKMIFWNKETQLKDFVGDNEEDYEEEEPVIGKIEDLKIKSNGASNAPEKKKDEPKAEESSDNGEYLFSNSDSEKLSESEVASLSKANLRIARNEILARHGRIFEAEDLKNYFEGKSWYSGTIEPDDFDSAMDSRLNEVEKSNIELIKKYE